jgi:hypothetical protein
MDCGTLPDSQHSILIAAKRPGGTILGRSLVLVRTGEAMTNYGQIWLINRVRYTAHWSDH